eukprot:3935199-Rhodomonas_salina.1
MAWSVRACRRTCLTTPSPSLSLSLSLSLAERARAPAEQGARQRDCLPPRLPPRPRSRPCPRSLRRSLSPLPPSPRRTFPLLSLSLSFSRSLSRGALLSGIGMSGGVRSRVRGGGG